MADRGHAGGQCQCGRIKYRLTGEPLTLYVCHCRDCQKQSSSAFGMSMWVNRNEIEFVSDEPKLWTTHGDSGAAKICAFCGDCGTRIYHGSEDRDAPISLKAGTLDDTSGLQPIAHIWTKSAQRWVLIDRGKYRCYEGEPDDDELLRLWRERT